MLRGYFSIQLGARFSETIQLVKNNPYDLLVLCHTLDDYQQETLATIARETYPPVEILVLQTSSSSDKPFADHVFEITRGPWQLVTKCAQIVGIRIRSRVRHNAAASQRQAQVE